MASRFKSSQSFVTIRSQTHSGSERFFMFDWIVAGGLALGGIVISRIVGSIGQAPPAITCQCSCASSGLFGGFGDSLLMLLSILLSSVTVYLVWEVRRLRAVVSGSIQTQRSAQAPGQPAITDQSATGGINAPAGRGVPIRKGLGVFTQQ